MRKNAVVIRDLRVVRGGRPIIDGLELDVPAGSVVGLLGPSGSGKTTLMRTVVGVQDKVTGTVQVLDAAAGSPGLRRKVGYMTQDASVYTDLTVAQNLRYFAALAGVASPAKAVAAAVATVDLGGHEKQRVGTLSGGERSRVSLAAALVSDPELLVLDEPTVGLDPVARDSVWARVQEMQERYGMTVLLTTHYMEEADILCDRVALLHLGRLRAVGTPEELKAALGPGASLEDVFRHHTGESLEGQAKGGLRDVRGTRRTAQRLG